MAKKPFEIQSADLKLGGITLQAGVDSVVIPGITQASSYRVDEVEDTEFDQTRQFSTVPEVLDSKGFSYYVDGGLHGGNPFAQYTAELDDDGYIDEIKVMVEGGYNSAAADIASGSDMYAYIGVEVDPYSTFVSGDWAEIPFRPKMRASGVENLGGGGNANTGDVTFDGVKIIGAGEASGDGYGNSTLELVPDSSFYENEQYLIIDPTTPNHIHIRAGGPQDNSNAILYLGGEKNHVSVQDNNGVYLTNEDTFSNSYYYASGAEFTDATWYVDNGNNYIRYTQTGSMMDIVTNSFGNNNQNTVQLYDGNNYFTLTATGWYGNLGGGTYALGVAEAPTDNITVNINTLDFNIITITTNEMYLANNDFRVDVADDVRIISGDVFRLVSNSTDGGIEIITDDNNVGYTWRFNSDGGTRLPRNNFSPISYLSSPQNDDTVTLSLGGGNGVEIVANEFTGGTSKWAFGTDGNITFPDATVQTTAYTGNGSLSTVAKTGNVAPLSGEVATITLSPTNNTNFVPGTYPGIFLGLGAGFSLTLTVAGNGDLTAEIISSNGGFQVGDFAMLNGAAITGGTTGVDDITVTVATLANIVGPTELDLTKAVQKLTDGYYSLADGVEGQTMILVRQDGSTAGNISLNIVNGRVNATSYTDIAFNPFLSNNQGDMTTLLFTDGAWQANNGAWD